MKTELTEVSDTRKHLTFEVPAEIVDAEIGRVANGYARSARVPGFRPGKVPTQVVRQRYRDQILHDVAHDVIPRLVGDALRERGLEPVAAPDIRDLVIEEGRPLTFLADFETLPPIDPGSYTGVQLRRPPAVLEVGAVDKALDQLRQRAAKFHPVEDRPAQTGDTVLVDLTRTPRTRLVHLAGEVPEQPQAEDAKPHSMPNVAIELGAANNAPGFDENLTGTRAGETRTFTVTYEADYAIKELAGLTVDYAVTINGLRRKELPALDDEFAKEISELDTLEALRQRVHDDLQHEAVHEADHRVRHDLLRALAGRLKAAPEVLVNHEIDRRLEELVRRMMEQGVDPMKAQLDWREFRERQREPAEETVKSTLVLDEIARREQIEATDEDLDKEIERFAERSGRTSAAVRARLEKEDSLDQIRGGIRREKTMTWLLDKAEITAG